MAFDSIHSQIEAERKAAQPDAEQLRTFRKYARGDQRGTLTTSQERILRGLLGNRFCDNICKRVLGELRNRLRLARYEVPSVQITDYLQELWVLNQLPALSAALHWAMMRDGDAAISLNWVNGRVRLARERWWNGKTGMFVAYDSQEQPLYAVKDWHTNEGIARRTVWYPDKIERYSADGEGWRMMNLPDDPQPQNGLGQPVAWKDRSGNPLGIPIVHFANIQVPNDGAGDDLPGEPNPHYGMSELDGGMLGLQDEINDLHRDISAAARFAGYQMVWATGLSDQVDEEGNPIRFRVEPGAMFSEANADARFGTIPPGSIQELERALTIKLQAVSRMSAIPLHVIAGDWPSGEALLRAEMPLIDKVETIGASVGPAWASVAHKATRLANTFGSMGLDEDALIKTIFLPVARRDPLTLSQIASNQAPFVSERQSLRTLGYAPEEIDMILAERAADQARGGVALGIQPPNSPGAPPPPAS